MAEATGRFVVDAPLAGLRLDVGAARALGCPRGESRRAIEDGAAYIDGKRCRVPAELLRLGQDVHILPAAPDRSSVGGGGVRIVHEDAWVLVLDKPAGLPSQPPPRGGDALSLRATVHLDRAAGEVHRLDRDVSGLVVYGCQPAATRELASQLQDRTAGRRYLALVRSAVPVPAQVIDEPLREVAPGRMAVDPTGLPARTSLVPLAFDAAARLALVRVTLDSGRMHQVRVHVAQCVGALAGDSLYGDPFAAADSRIGLHAAELRCRHPGTGQEAVWRALPGPDFWQLAGDAHLPLPEDWHARPDIPL